MWLLLQQAYQDRILFTGNSIDDKHNIWYLCNLQSNSSQSSVDGPCGPDDSSDFSWYVDFCPTTTAISWTIIVSLAAYLISFAAGTDSDTNCKDKILHESLTLINDYIMYESMQILLQELLQFHGQ